MARVAKNKNYNLNRKFSDDSGNLYPQATADKLRAWIRMSASSPTDAGPYALSPTYLNTPTLTSASLGNVEYDAVVTSDSANQYVSVTSTAGALSFSSAASGGTPSAGSDRPFSVSLWVKVTSLSSLNLLFLKDTSATPSLLYEYRATIDATTGLLRFMIRDDNASKNASIVTSSGVSADRWYHLVFTYDGRGGATAADGLQIYVDSSLSSVSRTNDASYVGMNPVYTQPLYIASDYDGADQLDGQISEFAVWSKALTLEEILSIYNTTTGNFRSSGFISNPPRVVLQERSSRTGSYPTIARTGDPDFTGVYGSFFNDTDAISFVGNNLTVYPTALPSTSKWSRAAVATPNILQGLTTIGSASKGVADIHVSFTGGENIKPFDESRIFVDNTRDFYKTGSNPSFLPSLDQKLSSKTIITIDANPIARRDFFFSTGSAVSDTPVNSGIGYFSWDERKWHVIRSSGTGSNVDYVNPNVAIRSSAPRAFTSRAEFYPDTATADRPLIAPHIGIPHSTCGFPFATQFDATGSQILSLSASLSCPFLVEKISLEFSASFPAFTDASIVAGSSFAEGPNVYQFFLMRVSKRPVNFTVDIEQDLTGSSTGAVAGKGITTFTVNQYKDLIWTGEISRFDNYTAQPAGWYRDLNLSGALGVQGVSAVTGSYRVEAPCRVFGSTSGLLTSPIRSDGASVVPEVPLLANKLGFRNFAGIAEGRSFLKSVAGTVSSGTLFVDDNNTSYKYAIPQIANIRFDSPYVLMPEDGIVLGFANQSIISGGPTDSVYESYTEHKISQQVVTLAPGVGKITLFGSLLRNNLPVSPELNQPLTSDSIHEDVHYDNPVFDQFDVEPSVVLSGSYVDLIVTGSMLSSPIGNPFAPNTRQVIASVAAGRAGSTGSLQRFVSLLNPGESLYDSKTPEINTFLSALEASAPDNSTAGLPFTKRNIFIYAAGGTGAEPVTLNVKFANSFPFAGPLSRVKRTATPEKIFSTPLLAARGGNDLQPLGSVGFVYYSPDSGLEIKRVFGATLPGPRQSFQNALKSLFGFVKPGISGSLVPNPGPEVTDNSYSTEDIVIRGYKYGLGGLFSSVQSVKFRRDRFGQFRDMLEQSTNSSYVSPDNSIERAVEVLFFSRPSLSGSGAGSVQVSPSQTKSQNLSSFATSSLPYFDGVAVDRTDRYE